jgi:hypothetical protein
MIGGGHVRRMSVSSAVEASPCARAGKRKYTPNTDPVEQYLEQLESPKKARLIEVKPSIESTSSLMFGDERMERATKGLLERQSLEETCFVGSGEDSSVSSEFLFDPLFQSDPAPQCTLYQYFPAPVQALVLARVHALLRALAETLHHCLVQTPHQSVLNRVLMYPFWT